MKSRSNSNGPPYDYLGPRLILNAKIITSEETQGELLKPSLSTDLVYHVWRIDRLCLMMNIGPNVLKLNVFS